MGAVTATKHDVLAIGSVRALTDYCEGLWFMDRRRDPALWVVRSEVHFEIPVMERRRAKPIGYLDATVTVSSWSRPGEFVRNCDSIASLERQRGNWTDIARENLGEAALESLVKYLPTIGDPLVGADVQCRLAVCEFKTDIRDVGALLRQLNKYQAWSRRADVYFDTPTPRRAPDRFLLMTQRPIPDELDDLLFRQGWASVSADRDLFR